MVSYSFNTNIIEEQSIYRPSFFDRNRYNYWMCRMQVYLKSIDLDLWDIVVNGYTPSKNDYKKWNENEKKLATLDAKGLNTLFCAISQDHFNYISNCNTSHEAWHNLEVTHEGTNQVKETKINMHVHKYELFKMKQNEPIGEMFTRFSEITNSLQALGKGYSQSDLVRKILRSLTLKWEKKTTAIEEVKDLSNYSLENLIGNLTSYEVQMREKENEKTQNKKTIALKNTTDSGDFENEDEDEDITF